MHVSFEMQYMGIPILISICGKSELTNISSIRFSKNVQDIQVKPTSSYSKSWSKDYHVCFMLDQTDKIEQPMTSRSYPVIENSRKWYNICDCDDISLFSGICFQIALYILQGRKHT